MDLRIADQSAFLWSVCYQIMPGFNDIFRLLLLVVAVTSDGFCAAFGLGASGIIIPPKSAAVISASGAAFLTISAALGGTVVSLIPSGVCSVISSVILALLGLFNIFHKAFEKLSCKLPENSRFRVCLSDEAADSDRSKDISCKEALVLSAALSADSLAAGLGAGLGAVPMLPIALLSFVTGFVFVVTANKLGKKASSNKKLDLRGLCGALLIIFAIINL